MNYLVDVSFYVTVDCQGFETAVAQALDKIFAAEVHPSYVTVNPKKEDADEHRV